jgi:hypothetical protein
MNWEDRNRQRLPEYRGLKDDQNSAPNSDGFLPLTIDALNTFDDRESCLSGSDERLGPQKTCAPHE